MSPYLLHNDPNKHKTKLSSEKFNIVDQQSPPKVVSRGMCG